MGKLIMIIGLFMALYAEAAPEVTKMIPANGAVDVNPDTHLSLTLSEAVTIGDKGYISIYDKQTGKLVDRLDLSIPAGPTKGQPANPLAQYTPVPYEYKPIPFLSCHRAWTAGHHLLASQHVGIWS